MKLEQKNIATDIWFDGRKIGSSYWSEPGQNFEFSAEISKGFGVSGKGYSTENAIENAIKGTRKQYLEMVAAIDAFAAKIGLEPEQPQSAQPSPSTGEIAACPLCGGECKDATPTETDSFITCMKCGLNSSVYPRDQKVKMLADWNRRVQPASPDALTEPHFYVKQNRNQFELRVRGSNECIWIYDHKNMAHEFCENLNDAIASRQPAPVATEPVFYVKNNSQIWMRGVNDSIECYGYRQDAIARCDALNAALPQMSPVQAAGPELAEALKKAVNRIRFWRKCAEDYGDKLIGIWDIYFNAKDGDMASIRAALAKAGESLEEL